MLSARDKILMLLLHLMIGGHWQMLAYVSETVLLLEKRATYTEGGFSSSNSVSTALGCKC